jgi:hypothetical protein
MNNIDCIRFEDCSAPACPLQQNTTDNGIWYPGEEICVAKKFQTLPWIKKQKAIAKVKAPTDRYFTVKMLEAIRQVRKGIEGISPDQPLEQARNAERRWIVEKGGGRVVANQNPKPARVTRAKRSNLDAVGESSYRVKGGKE